MTYRPLPPCLTIGKSEIDGLGLFATEDIPAGTDLGISHIEDPAFRDGYVRTPLGGFFNHSDTPNCEAKLTHVDGRNEIHLKTIKDIKAGDELTAHYWLYALTPKTER